MPAALFDERWGSLLGAPVRAHPGVPRLLTHDALRAAWTLGRPLVAAWGHPSLGTFLVALPRDLAFLLVTQALGPECSASPLAPLSEVAEGVLSALAARVAVTLCAPAAPPVLRAITDHPGDALDTLPPSAPLAAWDFTLSGKTLPGVVTLVLATDALRSPARPPTLDLGRFAEASVAVRCVAARAEVPSGAVAALAPGDRVMLDGLRWSAGALEGDVTLLLGAAPPLRLDATLTAAPRVTVTVAAPPRGPWSPTMHESTELLRDLRVEVTVEIASSSESLEAVASWGPGAVVGFPQRVGEAVLVRAGGRVVARGELVDLDGQVGVRVTERI